MLILRSTLSVLIERLLPSRLRRACLLRFLSKVRPKLVIDYDLKSAEAIVELPGVMYEVVFEFDRILLRSEDIACNHA